MKTKLFLDTEFNGFLGELLSMGIIDENGREFYEVLDIKVTNKWVIENVVPHLEKTPVSIPEFQDRLYNFLSFYKNGVCVIADWPEDIQHFVQSLITEPGQMMNISPFEMHVIRELSSEKSKLPHHALHDARAIKEAWEKGSGGYNKK